MTLITVFIFEKVTKPKPIGCEQLVEKCENMEGCG